MAEKSLYITRPEGDDLYTVLQRKTLEELQRISGEVWTDYNPHDPGITIADTVNYALTEIDYKLNFNFEDYLTSPNGTWQTGKYGLFPASEVYPTTPVKADDYRRLVLAHFPMVQQVTVKTDRETQTYDFRLSLSPFYDDENSIIGRVRYFLNNHRNLCENIGKVEICHPKPLTFEAEFEISPEFNATDILVQVYWKSMHYLSGSVRLETDDSCKSEKKEDMDNCRPDIWYDGPVEDIRVVIPEQKNTQHELYWKLYEIEGIRNFKTCWFKDKEGNPVTDFSDGYMLQIPDELQNVRVKVRDELVYADVEEFKERLKAMYFMRTSLHTRHIMQKNGRGTNETYGKTSAEETVRKARYRNIFDHFPVSRELPKCFHTSEADFKSDSNGKEKADAVNFGNYLRLFDLLMKRSLGELDGMKSVLSLNETDNPEQIPLLPNEDIDLHKVKDKFRTVTDLKNRYMDFLDGLYGVESAPAWLKKFDYYNSTESNRLHRRMAFLREVPGLIGQRARGRNITGPLGEDNIPTIKRYLSLLLDFNCDEKIAVGNVLPGHNLILMGDSEKGQHVRELMNSAMIDDSLFVTDTMETIELDDPPKTETEKRERYEDLRRHLPIFNSNWISGSLFREGIRLSAYNLVKAGYGEWLLIFQGREERLRMNLGRSDNKERLRSRANTLCRYLRDLNRQCEAVYVVEKSLFDPAEPLTVVLVFTGWTARTHSRAFRDACTRLARTVLPAHLKMETRWLNSSQMQRFEDCYRKWNDCLAGRLPEEAKTFLQKTMMNIIEKQDKA